MSLKPCPDSPNCVSTQADTDDAQHHIDPVEYSSDPQAVIDAIVDTLSSNGGRVVAHTDTTVEAVFTSKLLKFKDDVSFELDTDAQLIHFRSASRTGHSDLGANRKRMVDLIPRILSRLA